MLQCVLQLIFQNVFLSSMETAWRTSFHNTVVIVRCCSVCCSWHFWICFSAHNTTAWRVGRDNWTRGTPQWIVTWSCLFASPLRWLFHTCDVTHWYVCRDSFKCGTWLVFVSRDTAMNCLYWIVCIVFMCVTWLIHMCDGSCFLVEEHRDELSREAAFVRRRSSQACDMTHSYVWHDSFVCVAWLFHTCDVTHWYMCRDSLICVPWLIHMCDVIHMCFEGHRDELSREAASLRYGVATVSRIDKIVGLFCRILSLL